jgi:hypothetical protein
METLTSKRVGTGMRMGKGIGTQPNLHAAWSRRRHRARRGEEGVLSEVQKVPFIDQLLIRIPSIHTYTYYLPPRASPPPSPLHTRLFRPCFLKKIIALMLCF